MISFLKPAPKVKRLPEDKIKASYKKYRIRMFIMIIIGYMSYYLVRKNFAIASPLLVQNLHFSKTEIGLISSAFAISYGLSKFILGTLADKSHIRNYLCTGLLASAIINICLGFTKSLWIFVVLMILNGIFQAMGAPVCHIVIGKWFRKNERGLKMGIWNTSHNIGGGLVGPLGTLALILFGANHYQSIFLLPAAICILIVIFMFTIGADTPESVGLPSIQEYYNEEVTEEEKNIDKNSISVRDIMFKYVLRNKYVWILAITNIFVYIVRQGIVDWIPIYLSQAKHFSIADANWAMMIFEYSAIPATILIGWLSDVLFKGNRAPLGIVCMIGVVAALFIYWKTDSYLVSMLSVAFIGCFIYGPAVLINMSLIDLVPKFAIGSADGFAGLTAYVIGELNADLGLGFIADKFGWNGSFMFIIGGAICGLIGLIILQLAVKGSRKKNSVS
ncbi:MFS transporter [Clostridium botulinum]|uniref:MFS transporter n=1 Tax=Clostridium botulinum TaxID=1491 RepID=UPI0004D78709|nr:MFS transporter [Clostridium botulinum]KEH96729.1 MFS transporter [Clostridium botulinum D str. 16868]KLU74565.1 MFS transporter [Clostridium botulinum V891]KOC32918.1 MFS transporter [Clostridium botulinum]MCD3254857.1 MFS transporter [Clostridium botulinum C/D]MCD3280343.1 MFS transporter [Clostridium botulinum C/D]